MVEKVIQFPTTELHMLRNLRNEIQAMPLPNSSLYNRITEVNKNLLDRMLFPPQWKLGALEDSVLTVEGMIPDSKVEALQGIQDGVVLNAYYLHLGQTIQYLEGPTSFYNAYYWIQSHPIFWLHTSGTRNDGFTPESIAPQRIIDHHVYYHPKYQAGAHFLQAFPMHPNKFDEQNHDIRLDSQAPTYDEAIVKLAASIYDVYEWTGVERTPVMPRGLDYLALNAVELYESESRLTDILSEEYV